MKTSFAMASLAAVSQAIRLKNTENCTTLDGCVAEW
jgi:hypothetical protein